MTDERGKSMKNNMAKEKNKFVNWLSENVSYCDKLSCDEMSELNELYDKLERALEIENNVINMAFNQNKVGLDYSNDFEKAMGYRVRCQQALFLCVNRLNHIYLGNDIKNSGGIRK